MKLHQLYLTKNDCYKAGQKINVKGLMLHSTGANNPKLSRYIGPDDGILGKNPNGNHWNNPGITKCVHGFIGKDKNGDIRTYQTLPWNHRGWHAGGSANNSYIGVEICEDDLKDPIYFKLVYREAVELFAHLCKKFGLSPKDVIDHSEGRKRGIASNHGDVMHWFPKHGKSMDTFRRDVGIQMLGKPVVTQPTPKPTPKPEPVKEVKLLELSKTQREALAEVYKKAHTEGIFSSDEHVKDVLNEKMTESKAIYLNGLILGTLLNDGTRLK